MSPSSNPPPLPPVPDMIPGDERRARDPARWVAWGLLTMLAAIIASCSDRVVDRMFAAFEDQRSPQLAVPQASQAVPVVNRVAVVHDDAPSPLIVPQAVIPATHVPPPQGDLAPIEPEPAGPEGEAGIAVAMRAGKLRPAAPSDIAQWISRHSAQGGSVDADAPQISLLPVYVVTGNLTFPAGLHGAHSATFIVPTGIPYPSGDPGHSLVLDMGSGACVGFGCRSLRR